MAFRLALAALRLELVVFSSAKDSDEDDSATVEVDVTYAVFLARTHDVERLLNAAAAAEETKGTYGSGCFSKGQEPGEGPRKQMPRLRVGIEIG